MCRLLLGQTEPQSSRVQAAGLRRCISSTVWVARLSRCMQSGPGGFDASKSVRRGGGECAMGVPRLSTTTRWAAESQQVNLCSERLWCQGAGEQDADQCAEAEQLLGYSLLCKSPQPRGCFGMSPASCYLLRLAMPAHTHVGSHIPAVCMICDQCSSSSGCFINAIFPPAMRSGPLGLSRW